MKSLFHNHSFNNGYHQTVESQNKRKSLLFDRVQNESKISDFRKYIHKNVNIYHTDNHKRTILMFSAQNYHLEVFTYLVDNYPKLILHNDDNDMNIMHYIASSNTDDDSMISLITNKKFCYNKLVWMRTKNGLLPKDIARESHNKRIIKALESIMHDTWSEYSYIARDNNCNLQPLQLHINNDSNSISDSDDMDLDQNDHKSQNQATSQSNSICSRKRRLIENDDAEDCYMAAFNISKRRKLSDLTFVRMTQQQPTLSPSPLILPPLPPIGLPPFSLLMSDTTDIDTTTDNSSVSVSVSGCTFLSLPCTKLNQNPPKLNRMNHRSNPNKCVNGLWSSFPSDIKTMSGNQVFGEYNNNICIGGMSHESNVEIERFSDRMRELQLSERMNRSDCDNVSEDDDL